MRRWWPARTCRRSPAGIPSPCAPSTRSTGLPASPCLRRRSGGSTPSRTDCSSGRSQRGRPRSPRTEPRCSHARSARWLDRPRLPLLRSGPSSQDRRHPVAARAGPAGPGAVRHLASPRDPRRARCREARRTCWLAARIARVPFSGVVLVGKDGAPLFAKAYGLADRGANVANTVDTRFNLGSSSKMFTALAVEQLADAGRLGLNDPVQRYLPTFGPRELAPATIRHLLTHTSGLGDVFRPPFHEDRARFARAAGLSPDVPSRPPRVPPGRASYLHEPGIPGPGPRRRDGDRRELRRVRARSRVGSRGHERHQQRRLRRAHGEPRDRLHASHGGRGMDPRDTAQRSHEPREGVAGGVHGLQRPSICCASPARCSRARS